MIEICPKEECTGCGACSGVCPKKCIQMVELNPINATYPVINQDQCIDCGLCAKICPNNNYTEFHTPLNVYAAWSLNNSDRDSSTSGGLGSVLTSQFIKQGGIGYGAVVKPGIVVEHNRASTIEESIQFKKSKYVQSSISSDIIQAIISDLKNGLHVLFTGTPCQCAGIKKATRDHPNLTTIDIICHGVPPIYILREHIKMVYGDYKAITSFSTRDKQGYILTLKKDGKQIYRKPLHKDAYIYGFQYSLFCRDNCYTCKYARPERCSDITIGDFWGLGKTNYPHKKVSVVLVNTPKGEKLLNQAKTDLFLEKRSLTEAVNGNPQLQRPAKPHELHRFFKKNLKRFGYKLTINLSLMKFRVKYPLSTILMKIPWFKHHYCNSTQTNN